MTWGRFHQHFICIFLARRSQKRKKYSQAVSLFVFLGSVSIKDVRKTLVKLTPAAIQ